MKFRIRKLLICGGMALMAPFLVAAQSSTNYTLIGDVVSGGGEDAMTSTNYTLSGSVGEAGGGDQATSSSYTLNPGFEGIFEAPVLTVTISGTNLTLTPTPMDDAAVSTDSSTITVSTNAESGYGLEIYTTKEFQSSGGTIITAVADGAVTAGADEFGIAVSGTHAAFGDDRSVTAATPRTIASTTSKVPTGVTTTVTFKAALAAAAPSGAYDGTYQAVATGNF